jgi:hypothetical protein
MELWTDVFISSGWMLELEGRRITPHQASKTGGEPVARMKGFVEPAMGSIEGPLLRGVVVFSTGAEHLVDSIDSLQIKALDFLFLCHFEV